jgi:hypothetical protein
LRLRSDIKVGRHGDLAVMNGDNLIIHYVRVSYRCTIGSSEQLAAHPG